MVAELPHGDIGRQLFTQQVHYHWTKFTHADMKNGIKVGVLPRNALVVDILVFIDTAMNGKKVQVGTAASAKLFGETANGNVGIQHIAPEANKVWSPSKDEIEIVAKTDSEANAGNGSVVILFVADI